MKRYDVPPSVPVCLSQHNIGCLGAANFAAVARPAIDCCTAHSSAACDGRMRAVPMIGEIITTAVYAEVVDKDDVFVM